MKYFVYSNLKHNNELFQKGQQVELDESVAMPLVRDGVVGESEQSEPVATEETPSETADLAASGTVRAQSGEPSIDGVKAPQGGVLGAVASAFGFNKPKEAEPVTEPDTQAPQTQNTQEPQQPEVKDPSAGL